MNFTTMSDTETRTVAIFFYVLISVTSCVFNICLIGVIVSTRSIRTITNIFVASLAISDFIVGGFVVLADVQHALKTDVNVTGYLCLVDQSLQIFIPLVSCFHLLAIAMERYVKICQPLRYTVIATRSRVALALSITWLVPLFVSALPSFGWNNIVVISAHGTNRTNGSDAVTFTDGTRNITTCNNLETIPCSYKMLMICIIMIITTLMSTIYGRILIIAFSHAKRISALGYTNEANGKLIKTEIKTLIVLLATVGFFFLSWMPLCGVVFYECLRSTPPDDWWTVCLFIAYANSTVNPLLYGIGNRDIRRMILVKIFCKKGRIEPDITLFGTAKTGTSRGKQPPLQKVPECSDRGGAQITYHA